jgi:hypothetical protein
MGAPFTVDAVVIVVILQIQCAINEWRQSIERLFWVAFSGIHDGVSRRIKCILYESLSDGQKSLNWNNHIE